MVAHVSQSTIIITKKQKPAVKGIHDPRSLIVAGVGLNGFSGCGGGGSTEWRRSSPEENTAQAEVQSGTQSYW